MKGMKAFEFKVWARCYVKHKGDFSKLNEIRNKIRSRRAAPYISLLGWRAPLTLPPLVDTISLKDEDIVRSLAKVKASNDSDI